MVSVETHGYHTFVSPARRIKPARFSVVAKSQSRCISCNEGQGKVKISDERFTVSDRNSGRVVAQSPSLHVQVHGCWLALGSCTEYERPSELQMSEDGKAVLAFSPPLDYAQTKPGDAKVEVFYRR